MNNLEEEHKKCIESPYYFYTKYFQIHGKPATTPMSKEEFNKAIEAMEECTPIRLYDNKR